MSAVSDSDDLACKAPYDSMKVLRAISTTVRGLAAPELSRNRKTKLNIHPGVVDVLHVAGVDGVHVVQLLANPPDVGVRCIDGPLDQSLSGQRRHCLGYYPDLGGSKKQIPLRVPKNDPIVV